MLLTGLLAGVQYWCACAHSILVPFVHICAQLYTHAFALLFCALHLMHNVLCWMQAGSPFVVCPASNAQCMYCAGCRQGSHYRGCASALLLCGMCIKLNAHCSVFDAGPASNTLQCRSHITVGVQVHWFFCCVHCI